jgi:hypothetical protein
MKKLSKKTKIISGVVIALLLIIGGVILISSRKPEKEEIIQPPSTRTKKQTNLIPKEDRPYVTLQPLSGRNKLEFVIHDLKKDAKEVELTLEYDRNEGVLDAVLYTYALDSIPLTEEAFLGSKSAGGHITYHDDVIGGTMYLDFTDDDYSLEVPWRYIDTQTSYDMLSTSDGKFQLVLDEPIRQSKVIIMESPGLPENIKKDILAGPYFVSTVGDLPDTTAEVKIRLSEESETATIMGWDGEEWVEYDTTLDGKTASANEALYQTYIVVK